MIIEARNIKDGPGHFVAHDSESDNVHSPWVPHEV